MQVLPNGQVQITNNQTGETRVISPDQLAGYSPLLMNQYLAYMTTQKALGKGSGTAGNGTADTLLPPSSDMTSSNPSMPTTATSTKPDLSGLSRFATPVMQRPQPQPVPLTAGLNALSAPMGGVNTMGQVATPYTNPVQTQQAKPKPQTPLSTFDISKVRF